MPAQIIDRGRGPKIAGTRVTVYDVWEYAKHGYHHSYIATIFGLSSGEIQAALAYIEEHKANVLADYAEIMARIRKGNSPAIEALRKESHARLMKLKKELQRKNRRGSKHERNSRGRTRQKAR